MSIMILSVSKGHLLVLKSTFFPQQKNRHFCGTKDKVIAKVICVTITY